MKYSIYTKMVKYKGKTILYNTKDSKLVMLSHELKDEWDISQDEINFLLKEKFLVDDFQDEFQEVIDRRKEYLNHEKDYMRYTIFPTTCCNAKCAFCYENGEERISMSDDTIAKTINFIEQDMLQKKCKKLRIYWFGGEPLVRKDIMEKITDQLIEFCTKENISYSASIASNMSLIDKKNVNDQFNRFKINKVEFAFDGFHHQHNKVKNYSDSSFDAYMHNIEMIDDLLKNNITVQIRLNAHKDNFYELMKVAEVLLKKYPQNENLIIYLGLIFKTPNSKSKDDDKLIEFYEMSKYLIEFYKFLYKYEKIKDASDLPICYKTNNCYASNRNSLVIAPNGDLSKCQLSFNNHVIGNVTDGIAYDSSNYKSWTETDYFDECKQCIVFPMCLTGCIAQKISYNEVPCCKEKYYFEKLLSLAIELQEYNELIPEKVYSLKRSKR